MLAVYRGKREQEYRLLLRMRPRTAYSVSVGGGGESETILSRKMLGLPTGCMERLTCSLVLGQGGIARFHAWSVADWRCAARRYR